MVDWKEYRIGELGQFIGGGTPSTTEPEYWDGAIAWMVPSDISSSEKNFISATAARITARGLKSSSAYLLPVGTVCMSSRATIGDCVINAVALATNQGFINVVCNDNVLPLYLLYWIRQNKNYILRYAAGTTFAEIGKSTFKRLKVSLPERQEQTAIATLLSRVDAALAATEASIRAAERLKKGLLQQLLTGQLTPDGRRRGEEEFTIDPKFGKVPVGWEVKKLKEISSLVQYGLNATSDVSGTYPMFRMNNIIQGRMVAHPMAYVELPTPEFEKYKLGKGDILFNRTNSLDLVGKVGIFALEGDYVFASYLIRVRVTDEHDAEYVNHVLNSYPTQCSLRSKATPAVSQANINASSLRNTWLMCPPLDEQQAIVKKVAQVEEVCKAKRTKITTLRRLKKSLMQHLLTGKVRLTAAQIAALQPQPEAALAAAV